VNNRKSASFAAFLHPIAHVVILLFLNRIIHAVETFQSDIIVFQLNVCVVSVQTIVKSASGIVKTLVVHVVNQSTSNLIFLVASELHFIISVVSATGSPAPPPPVSNVGAEVAQLLVKTFQESHNATAVYTPLLFLYITLLFAIVSSSCTVSISFASRIKYSQFIFIY